MNATLDRAAFAVGEPVASAPAITVRDRRFGRNAPAAAGEAPVRWWLDGDPVATAWHNALSATFPRGEALFIESVKAFREGAPPELAEAIRDFVKQEVNHTREHLAFNRAAEAAGYDLTHIDARVKRLIEDVYAQPQIAWLGITMALEHFTAMFAHEFLTNSEHFGNVANDQAELWRWHAVEEIEHKAVAYDTWIHATRDWSRWKRWRIKSVLMLLVSARFIRHRSGDALNLLAQDGISGWPARLRLAKYLTVSPGMIRRIFPQWCAYFAPGFHPWNLDDRALIGRYDAERQHPTTAPAR